MKRHFVILPLILLSCLAELRSDTLLISAGSPTRTAGEVEADYTTSTFFVDEIAGDSFPITFFFDPQTLGVESVELFTNLNRRDLADDDADGDGIQDGILWPDGNQIATGDDTHYFKAYSMQVGADGYYLTLHANRTGAYRATARYRLVGDPAGTYRWYNGRDHAIVVSPATSRDIRLYEINVLNMEASGTLFSQRSTFEDLSDRPGAIHTAPGRVNNFNLDYLQNLGVNWLWFQPYHPYGWEGRHLSSANINARDPNQTSTTWLYNSGNPYEDVNFPFELGSPYAVKNFWEIESRMTAKFVGDPTNLTDVSSAANRAAAMVAFQNFAEDADAAGINLMPDAAFNHTAWDVELGPPGIATDNGNPNVSWMAAQNATGWAETDTITSRELRVFSRAGDYRQRASTYIDFFNNNVAPGPDRTDFGKWLDVADIFFGRYAALVGAQDGSEQNNYNNEGDWIDQSEADWDGTTGGSFDAFTRATWYYFAQYAPYWLEKTRGTQPNRNSLPSDGTDEERYQWDARGIDGLRCDFGQGLPPQAWEYIINVARSYKWSFVFMAETLDGGAPPYRSNRHFDILNENILFAAKGAGARDDFVNMFETRRASFGQGLVLLNTVSHDEDNYLNPWDALARFAIFSTVDGAPMIFPGQELGISTFFGYDLMERNFGKYIPHFKTYNSMMPLWSDTDFGNDQLYQVYAAVNAAREFSPALRSSNRWFLYGDGNNTEIYGVAKYTEENAPLPQQDVVLAFANVNVNGSPSDNFKIPEGLFTRLGMQDGRTYNVKNIAAYLNEGIGMGGRRDRWLWGSGITGASLKSGGFFVGLNRVPNVTGGVTADPPETTTAAAWNQNPYEAQYLKVYDVTAPAVAPGQPAPSGTGDYVLDTVTFDWPDVGPDSGGVTPHYEVTVTLNGVQADPVVVTQSEYEIQSSVVGDGVVSIDVRAVNPDEPSNGGPSSTSTQTVLLLSADGDWDEDGKTNQQEADSGTNPDDILSVFQIVNPVSTASGMAFDVEVVEDYYYTVESTTDLTDAESWSAEGDEFQADATGRVDFLDPDPGAEPKYYRVRVSSVPLTP